MTRRTSFMLSGAQLGITVTGLLVGYVAEPLIGDSVGELLDHAGVPVAVGIAVGTVLALLLSALVQMLFGELFPKNLAIARPEPVADRLARSTLGYLRVAGPLIWFFDQASHLLLRMLRIEPVHDVEHSATARDLEHIVARSRVTGDLPVELSVLLDRVLDFPTRDVEHAMVPRARVDVVAEGAAAAEVRRLMATGHSRYPVLTAEDQVCGVVHLSDLLAAAPGTDLAVLMRPALVVPTRMALPDAVQELAGTGPLGQDLPEGDYQTIAGLVIAVRGRLPQVADVVEVRLPDDPADLVHDEAPRPSFARLEVVAVEQHVPATVRVTVVQQDQGES